MTTAPLPHLRLVDPGGTLPPSVNGLSAADIGTCNALARHADLAPPLAERETNNPRLQRALRRTRHYARQSLAESTQENYRYHWGRFVDWCDDAGVLALPADPEDVAAHLCELADGELDDQERLVVDTSGQVIRPPLAVATIDLRLAAINKFHEVQGFAKPGRSPACSEPLKGVRHSLGVRAKRRRDPLTLQLLRRVLEPIGSPPAGCWARDLAMVLLSDHRRIGPTILSRLTWDRVRIGEDTVVVLLHDGSAELPGRVATLPARPDRPEICPVRAMRAMEELTGRTGAVFPRIGPDRTATTKAMTDVAVHQAIARAARRVGVPGPATDRRWSDDQLTAIAHRLGERRLIDVRDHALLLTGFVGAVRRSNLAAFCWNDFTLVPEGLVVLLRKSKTDRVGAGFEVFLPYGSDPLTCPVAAWLAWRDRVAEILGGDPQLVAADQPCFAPLGRGDQLERDSDGRIRAMSDEAVNVMVRRRARAVGLQGNYGGHSLRAGFVTTLAELGVPIQQIAEQTGHKSLDVLRAYIRPIEARRSGPALALRQVDFTQRPEAPRRSGAPRRRYAGSQQHAAAAAGESSAGR